MAKPIINSLQHIGGGVFLDEAAENLAELVRAVEENGGAGVLTLEIKVRKYSRGGALILTGIPKLKKPAEPPLEALMFGTPEGNLETEDPNQMKLELKQVESSATIPATLKTAS